MQHFITIICSTYKKDEFDIWVKNKFNEHYGKVVRPVPKIKLMSEDWDDIKSFDYKEK